MTTHSYARRVLLCSTCDGVQRIMPEELAAHVAPVGARVRVRVDPRHPHDAYLEVTG